MSVPTFNGFNLQDPTGTGVITSTLKYRNSPKRNVEADPITRRAGTRVVNVEYADRQVLLTGYILGSSPSDLQTKIDALNASVTGAQSGTFSVDGTRSAVALVTNLDISEDSFNSDYVPFSMALMIPDGLFIGPQQSVSLVLASGTNTNTYNITITGSYYMFPTITVTPPATGTGQTPSTTVSIQYNTTAEVVTWSGTASLPKLAYSDTLSFDFSQQIITRNTTTENTFGSFAGFDPGARSFTVTFSGGTAVGGTLTFTYLPRYL